MKRTIEPTKASALWINTSGVNRPDRLGLLTLIAMKACHAAALALVGWYLMVPPPVLHSSVPVDLDAPLSKWRIFSSHDTAAQCEQGLVAFYKLAKTELAANPADERDRTQFYQLENSQCVASDDPLLKEK